MDVSPVSPDQNGKGGDRWFFVVCLDADLNLIFSGNQFDRNGRRCFGRFVEIFLIFKLRTTRRNQLVGAVVRQTDLIETREKIRGLRESISFEMIDGLESNGNEASATR